MLIYILDAKGLENNLQDNFLTGSQNYTTADKEVPTEEYSIPPSIGVTRIRTSWYASGRWLSNFMLYILNVLAPYSPYCQIFRNQQGAL